MAKAYQLTAYISEFTGEIFKTYDEAQAHDLSFACQILQPGRLATMTFQDALRLDDEATWAAIEWLAKNRFEINRPSRVKPVVHEPVEKPETPTVDITKEVFVGSHEGAGYLFGIGSRGSGDLLTNSITKTFDVPGVPETASIEIDDPSEVQF